MKGISTTEYLTEFRNQSKFLKFPEFVEWYNQKKKKLSSTSESTGESDTEPESTTIPTDSSSTDVEKEISSSMSSTFTAPVAGVYSLGNGSITLELEAGQTVDVNISQLPVTLTSPTQAD